MTRVVSINPADPPESRLAPGVDVLRAGGVLALPTETFYAIAVDTGSAAALARVNELKGKPPALPVLLLLAEPSQVEQVATDLPPLFGQLATMFWPGPLTLVVPAARGVSPRIADERSTVAVRVPGLALPRRIAARLGRPISGVSANRHREPPCRTAAEVAAAFPDGVALIYDGGTTTGGAPSTIVDLTTAPPRVVREGLVPRSALERFIPDLG